MTCVIELKPNVIRPEALFSIYYTASGTLRILQDGKVHPLLVGFHTRDEALQKLESLSKQQFTLLDDSVIFVRSDDITMKVTHERFRY